ncbi:hypothetical protein NPIL_475801 [Nephila pilipes]|uniref:Uncharacterized protein n=1 Tax=Nephila pilipes TaxID=299642 RepID=A0A8X6MCH4_NEPPI|nr:hypothetical protein NPIL_475801 [Nephila pilipes]
MLSNSTRFIHLPNPLSRLSYYESGQSPPSVVDGSVVKYETLHPLCSRMSPENVFQITDPSLNGCSPFTVPVIFESVFYLNMSIY